MERDKSGHSDSRTLMHSDVGTSPSPPTAHSGSAAQDDNTLTEGDQQSFDQIFAEYFPFVWRSLRRMGVQDSSVDDATQEVFLVVHRRLGDLKLRASMRSWLFGVVSRVAKDFRRSARRKDPRLRASEEGPDVDSLEDETARDPQELMELADATRALHDLLDELDWQKREAFVLVELEQMSVPEAAEALGVNLNTVYSRVRAARQAFNVAVGRRTARLQWREG